MRPYVVSTMRAFGTKFKMMKREARSWCLSFYFVFIVSFERTTTKSTIYLVAHIQMMLIVHTIYSEMPYRLKKNYIYELQWGAMDVKRKKQVLGGTTTKLRQEYERATNLV